MAKLPKPPAGRWRAVSFVMGVYLLINSHHLARVYGLPLPSRCVLPPRFLLTECTVLIIPQDSRKQLVVFTCNPLVNKDFTVGYKVFTNGRVLEGRRNLEIRREPSAGCFDHHQRSAFTLSCTAYC